MRKFKDICLKTVASLISAFIGLSVYSGVSGNFVAADPVDTISRAINVVYDDSDSMYFCGGTEGYDVDTWCQAKYSMEVFAAMLGANDTMNIYYMSDYDESESAPARISISGSDDVSENISKIHNETTTPGGTSLNSIRKACSDLESASADEKWLVVLTDGVIDDNPVSTTFVNEYFHGKSDDITVLFLAIGEYSRTIMTEPNYGIYSFLANSNDEIFDYVMLMCNWIYSANTLDVNVSTGEFSTDLPLKQVIVFAQGEDVTVNGIGALEPDRDVQINYSECDAVTRDNEPDTSLHGTVATFISSFDPGTYTIDATNAETLQVYFVPDVDIMVSFTDTNGNSVINASELEAGYYNYEISLVRGGTNEVITNSTLLGELAYSVNVTIGDYAIRYNDPSGSIQLAGGDTELEFRVKFLGYSQVSLTHSYVVNVPEVVSGNSTITFEVVDNPVFDVSSEGITTGEGIKIHALINGREFTQSEWDFLDVPVITFGNDVNNLKLTPTMLTKSDELGIFVLVPTLDGEPSSSSYKELTYSISISQSAGELQTWEGSMEGKIEFNDLRSFGDRNTRAIITTVVIVLLLAFAMLYMPFIKHYMPGMSKYPRINISNYATGSDSISKGEVTIDILSTILPVVPQKGNISFIPSSVPIPSFRVKAVGNGRMEIENVKDFAKYNISVGSKNLAEEVRENEGVKVTLGASTTIDTVYRKTDYTCVLK